MKRMIKKMNWAE